MGSKPEDPPCIWIPEAALRGQTEGGQTRKTRKTGNTDQRERILPWCVEADDGDVYHASDNESLPRPHGKAVPAVIFASAESWDSAEKRISYDEESSSLSFPDGLKLTCEGAPWEAPRGSSRGAEQQHHISLQKLVALVLDEREEPSRARAKHISFWLHPGESDADVRVSVKTQALEVEFIPGRNELFSRNKGLLEDSLINSKCVAVIGLGSGGSPVGVDLAKAGVGKFVLVDNDRVELSNVARHVCDTRDLGRLKTHAMRDAILSRNPYCTVVIGALNCVDQYEETLGLVKEHQCDLIIAATDSAESRKKVNELALDLGTCAIFGRTVRRASSGDVLRVRPGGKPCLDCVFNTESAIDENDKDMAIDRRQYVNDSDRDQVTMNPGLSNDIAPISQMMTKLAIVELSRADPAEKSPGPLESFDNSTDPTGMKRLDQDLGFAFYKWYNRREGSGVNFGPLQKFESSRLPRPDIFQNNWLGSSKNLGTLWKLLNDAPEFEILGNGIQPVPPFSLGDNEAEWGITFSHVTGRWTVALEEGFDEPGANPTRIHSRANTFSAPISVEPDEFLESIRSVISSQEARKVNLPFQGKIGEWFAIDVPCGCAGCDPDNAMKYMEENIKRKYGAGPPQDTRSAEEQTSSEYYNDGDDDAVAPTAAAATDSDEDDEDDDNDGGVENRNSHDTSGERRPSVDSMNGGSNERLEDEEDPDLGKREEQDQLEEPDGDSTETAINSEAREDALPPLPPSDKGKTQAKGRSGAAAGQGKSEDRMVLSNKPKRKGSLIRRLARRFSNSKASDSGAEDTSQSNGGAEDTSQSNGLLRRFSRSSRRSSQGSVRG